MEEAKQALLSHFHAQHLTITNHDIVIFTDFAAKVKYENFSNSTCEHPEQGTLCIAVVLNSPAQRPVQKDTTPRRSRDRPASRTWPSPTGARRHRLSRWASGSERR